MSHYVVDKQCYTDDDLDGRDPELVRVVGVALEARRIRRDHGRDLADAVFEPCPCAQPERLAIDCADDTGPDEHADLHRHERVVAGEQARDLLHDEDSERETDTIAYAVGLPDEVAVRGGKL